MGNIINGGLDVNAVLSAASEYAAKVLEWASQDPTNALSLAITVLGIYTSAVTLKQIYAAHKLKKSIMGRKNVKEALAGKSRKERRAFVKYLLRLQNQDITEANITKALADLNAEKTEAVGKAVVSEAPSPINGQQVGDTKPSVETQEKKAKGADISKISTTTLFLLLLANKMNDEEAATLNQSIEEAKETGQSKVVCDGVTFNIVVNDKNKSVAENDNTKSDAESDSANPEAEKCIEL